MRQQAIKSSSIYPTLPLSVYKNQLMVNDNQNTVSLYQRMREIIFDGHFDRPPARSSESFASIGWRECGKLGIPTEVREIILGAF